MCVISHPFVPLDLRIGRQGLLGDSRNDRDFGFERWRGGFRNGMRRVHVTGGVLRRDDLGAGELSVDLDAPQARQEIRDFTVDDMTAVELGCDLYGEPQLAPGGLDFLSLRDCANEIAS